MKLEKVYLVEEPVYAKDWREIVSEENDLTRHIEVKLVTSIYTTEWEARADAIKQLLAIKEPPSLPPEVKRVTGEVYVALARERQCLWIESVDAPRLPTGNVCAAYVETYPTQEIVALVTKDIGGFNVHATITGPAQLTTNQHVLDLDDALTATCETIRQIRRLLEAKPDAQA